MRKILLSLLFLLTFLQVRSQNLDTLSLQQSLAIASEFVQKQEYEEAILIFNETINQCIIAKEWDKAIDIIADTDFGTLAFSDHSSSAIRLLIVLEKELSSHRQEVTTSSMSVFWITMVKFYTFPKPLLSLIYLDSILTHPQKDSIQKFLLMDAIFRKSVHHYLEKDYKKAIIIADEGQEYGDTEQSILARLIFIKGLCYKELRELEKAEESLVESSLIFRKLNELLALGDCYGNLGSVYSLKKDFKNELETYKKAEACLPEHNTSLPELYGGIANLYSDTRNYTKSLSFNQKAIVESKKLEKNYQRLYRLYHNIGNIYYALEDYSLAIDYYKKSIFDIEYSLGNKDLLLADDYLKLMDIYTLTNDFEKAEKYYSNTLTLLAYNEQRGNNPKETIHQRGLLYSSLGALNYKKQDSEKAIVNYLEAEKEFKKISSFTNASECLREIAKCKIAESVYEETIIYCQNAFKYLIPTFENSNLLSNPKKEQIEYPNKVLDILIIKGAALFLWSKETEDYEILNNAEQTFLLAESILNELSLGLEGVSIKSLTKNRVAVYEYLIQITLSKNDKATQNEDKLNSIWQYLESTKFQSVSANLQTFESRQYFSLPDSILEKEYHLKIDKTYYEKELFLIEEDGIRKNEVTKKLFKLNRAYDELLESYRKDYPEYYALKFRPTFVTAKEIQQEFLKTQQTLIEFFDGDSSIYAFVISKDTMGLIHIKKDFPLLSSIEGLQANILIYDSLNQTRNIRLQSDYIDSLNNYTQLLYQKIWLPIEKQFHLREKIVIIPDGKLGYIPFDMLLKKLPEDKMLFHTYDYLLNTYQISYNYSSTLWKAMKDKENKANLGELLAFAPTFNEDREVTPLQPLAHNNRRNRSRGKFNALKFNIPEVETIQNLFGGTSFIDTAATEANFLKHAKDYRIIHLSTHGIINDEVGDYSYLAFTEIKDSIENEYLYNRDLYNLKLNADMVVLSACETGIGELQRGEGIISLARGFAYAGAKSIINTLWSVNDKSTSIIMESFYRNLKKGMTKDAALREAKKSFIQDPTNETHPFYWAAFIPSGDMSAIKLNKTSWMLKLMLFGVLGLMLFSFWKIKNR